MNHAETHHHTKVSPQPTREYNSHTLCKCDYASIMRVYSNKTLPVSASVQVHCPRQHSCMLVMLLIHADVHCSSQYLDFATMFKVHVLTYHPPPALLATYHPHHFCTCVKGTLKRKTSFLVLVNYSFTIPKKPCLL